ncbi:50S ribosomal protein L4 [Candidatus Saccharibacteria bacterium]|nr:50S ribosomal protein L4 [Candidatus Saccharibacteria bacterium]
MATADKSAVKSTLPKAVFSVDVTNHELVKLAYDSYLANSRQASATTLQRGEVRGGGKKPWKQKGTGRARFGSTRNPIWRGGGIVFGPRGNENYTKVLSKTAKRVATKQALSLANTANKVSLIDSFAVPSGKTKDAITLLEKAKVADKRRVLLVVDDKSDTVIRSTRNLQNIKLVKPNYLNVFDILNSDALVITKKSIPVIETWLIGDKEAK